MDDYFESRYGIYKKAKDHPDIVKHAKDGNYNEVKAIIDTVRSSSDASPLADVINASRRWTEVEDKWGYDKSWDWNDDTALIAATRCGHASTVRLLLETGECDPTLECCPNNDTYENALQVAQKNKFGLIETMLNVALQHWDKAPYASAGSKRNQFKNRMKGTVDQLIRKLDEALAGKNLKGGQ